MLKLRLKNCQKWKLIVVLLLASVGLILGIDCHISQHYNNLIYTDIEKIPKRQIALVLGTSRYAYGRYNSYYLYRIKAAAKLYQAGKVDGIVVSGDNSRKTYDEPTDMTEDLIEMGVAREHITQDYAGFSTLDSIIRSEKIFGLNNYIIVSQKFHCQRALFIAKAHGQEAIAFAAQDVRAIYQLRIRMRETLARLKAFIECKILNTGPKFLGPKEKIKYRNSQ